MKRILLFFSIFITAAMDKENLVDEIASIMVMTKKDAQECIRMTNVSREDLEHFSQVIENGSQTYDLDPRVMKTSCFYACLAEQAGVMSYGRIDKQMLDDMLNSYKTINRPREHRLVEIFYNCGQEDYDGLDPCAVNFRYLSCVIREKKLISNNNK